MSDNEQPIEWFLARDGKQHGPLSDIEMRKIVELGHLRPTDLIWRQGLVEWTPGAVVFPSTAQVEAAPTPDASAGAPEPTSGQRPETKPEPKPEAQGQGQPQYRAQQAPVASTPTAAPRTEPAPAPAAQQPAAQPQSRQLQPQAPTPARHLQHPAPAPGLATPAPGLSVQAAVANVAQHLEREPRPSPNAPTPTAPTAPASERRGPRDVRAAIAAAQWDRPVAPPANGPHSGAQPAPQPRPMPQQPAVVAMQTAPYQQQVPYPQSPHLHPPHPQAPGPLARAQHVPHPGQVPAPMSPMAPTATGARLGEPGRPRPVQVPPPPAQRPMPSEPQAYDLDEPEPRRRRRFPVKTAAAVVILSVLGGGAYALHKTGRLPLASVASDASGTSGDSSKAARAPKAGMGTEPALINIGSTAAEIDASLQKSSLWKLVKREFTPWYEERISDAAKLHMLQKNEKDVTEFLTKQLIDLRRRNADAVLAASPDRLMLVAISFVENLSRLAKHSTDACYGYISQGESSPLVLDLIRSPEHTSSLQAQFKAIIEAAAEGRKSPKQHKPPLREDYDVLAMELTKLKWSPADLQTFSDARALSQAAPAKVCQMVQDWFLAQLAVKDEDVKIRLLVEALKPVVAG